MSSARPGTQRFLALALLLASLCAGCRLVQSAAEVPNRVAGLFMPAGEEGSELLSPEELQTELMSLADASIERIAHASRTLFEAAETTEARIDIASWKVEAMRGVMRLVTGPNAVLNLLDLIVAVTTARLAHENYWIPHVWGEADRPVLETYTLLEADAWLLAERTFGAEGARQVRAALDHWVEQHPEISEGGSFRPPAFASLVQELSASGAEASSSLLGLVYLDPLAGIEPVAREVALARQFAERTLFYLQRAPRLLTAHIEAELLMARRQPEVEGTLAATERISFAAESLAATAAELPGAVSSEREALVAAFDEQRAALVADLATAQAPLSAMLGDAHEAFASAETMSTSLTETIRALGTFLDRFEPDENEEEKPPGKPFDITEYGATAAEIGGAVRELSALLAELDARMPEVEQTLGQAAETSERVLTRAFWLALGLGLALIAATAAAALLVRRSGARRPANDAGA